MKEKKGQRTLAAEVDTSDVKSDQPAIAPVALAARLQRFGRDLVGVGLLTLAGMTLLALALPDLASGFLLRWWGKLLWLWLGWGSLWLVIGFGVAGLLVLQSGKESRRINWARVYALELAALASLGLLTLFGGHSLERADLGNDGGRAGWGLVEVLKLLFAPLGPASDFVMLLVFSLITLFGITLGLGLERRLIRWLERLAQGEQPLPETDALAAGISVAPIQGADVGGSASSSKKKKLALPEQYRKNFRVEQREEGGDRAAVQRDERLPPLDLLSNEPPFRADERNINLTAGLIEKTLAEFGIPARVVGFRVGPTVTQFAVEPGFVERAGNEGDAARQKVRVAQISALSRDLALALSAERLRIQAPVPGRPYIGIEVPNSHSAVVRLKPILESEAFYNLNSPLAIALGRDVSGQPVVADLARMPHLLIAGTTGSGKSVCIAAITNCLVMNNLPEDLRLVMIDPKMVELVRFNGLPHLYGKVETDLQRILGVLHWTVVEMDRRYKLLEASRARNLDSYNRRARRRKDVEPLPRIVVFIDELADLMMSAPEETEPTLVRLAQMARATGIHLVVATQRPSTDVVTGLIKANFPARISFAVASSVDSRVILDTTGAESLLGRGDMLFMPPDAQSPLRSQGVMVSDQEVERVINFWQKTYPTNPDELPPWEKLLQEEAILADRDDLVKKAIAIVRETQRASASMLQRRLRIGYPRAARLIDELEALGVIGPAQGGGREREVIIGPEDETPEL